jgi:hypothetical protein
MNTPLLGDHFYKQRTVPEVRILVDDRETGGLAMLKSDYHHPGCTAVMRHTYMGRFHWFHHGVGSSTHIFPPHLRLAYLSVQYYALVLPVQYSLCWTPRPLSTGWCHLATMSKLAPVVVVVDKED